MFRNLTLCIGRETNGTTLHENDRLMSILADRSCRQAINGMCLYALQYILKCYRRHVVTFINYYHSVVFNNRLYAIAIKT